MEATTILTRRGSLGVLSPPLAGEGWVGVLFA